MFCTHCGNEMEPENATCPLCGFDLSHLMALYAEPDDEYEDSEDEIRDPAEIAKRVLSLAAVISCAYGDSRESVGSWLSAQGLWEKLSPLEKEFMAHDTSKAQNATFTWKIEALVPLLWAIHKIDKMPALHSECDTAPLKKAVIWPPHPADEYISGAEIRTEDEIFAEYEKVYQAHWQVRDAQLHNRTLPEKYNPEVVYERHYGFNWLIGYMGQDWDDITTDT